MQAVSQILLSPGLCKKQLVVFIGLEFRWDIVGCMMKISGDKTF